MTYVKSYFNAFWQLFKLGSAVYMALSLLSSAPDALYLAFVCALGAIGGPTGVMIGLKSDE